jgi:hypothetical protein
MMHTRPGSTSKGRLASSVFLKPPEKQKRVKIESPIARLEVLLDTAGAPSEKLALQPRCIPSVVCALVRGGYTEFDGLQANTCPCSALRGGSVHVDVVRRAIHADQEVYHTHRMPLTRCQSATPKPVQKTGAASVHAKKEECEISDARAFEILERASVLKSGGGHSKKQGQTFQSVLNRDLIPWWIKQTPGTHHRFHFNNTQTFLDFMVSSR